MLTQKITIFIITICTLIGGIITGCFASTGNDYFQKALVLAISGGLIGGGLYMARGFYQAVIKDEFDFQRFIWWYLLRPVMSAAAGGIAFIIGYLALDIQESFQNLATFFLVGVYAGFNFTTFAESRLKNLS